MASRPPTVAPTAGLPWLQESEDCLPEMGANRTIAREDRLAQGLLGLALLVTLLLGVTAGFVRPALYSDSALGFRVWDSMRQGTPFNHAMNVDPADIARDLSYFKGAWTPGQYLLPGALEALGLDLGVSIAIVVTLASLAGLGGWYALYRAFGFSPRTCSIALLLVALGRHFGLPFGIYNGGEVLLFGALPWGFLLIWRLRALPVWSIPLLLAATAAVTFLKLSGIIFMGAAIAAVVVADPAQPLLGRQTVRKSLVAGVTLVLSLLLLKWLWLSRGWTAVVPAISIAWSEAIPSAALVIAGTWTAIFGFGSLVQYVFFFPGRAMLASVTPINLVLQVPALATLVFLVVRLRRAYPDYLRFALIVTGLATGLLFVMLVSGSPLGDEERHYRPAALLLTVGVVEAFLGARSLLVRGLFAGLAALSVLYGVGSWVNHVRHNLQDTLGQRGVRLRSVPAPVLRFVREIDRPDADGERPLILVPSPELALEIRNARVLTTDADFQSLAVLASELKPGRVRRLYVVLPLSLERNGKADAILKSFVDYRPEDWKRTVVGPAAVYASVPEPR